jgi:hypothetical protein
MKFHSVILCFYCLTSSNISGVIAYFSSSFIVTIIANDTLHVELVFDVLFSFSYLIVTLVSIEYNVNSFVFHWNILKTK